VLGHGLSLYHFKLLRFELIARLIVRLHSHSYIFQELLLSRFNSYHQLLKHLSVVLVNIVRVVSADVIGWIDKVHVILAIRVTLNWSVHLIIL
jgi:hypothetical protein